MKNFAKIGLALTMLLTTFGVSAGEYDFSLKVTNETGKTVSFSVVDAETVTFSIYNSKEELIFNEKVSGSNAINRTYDLTAFPEGIYYLEAETAAKVARYEISVVKETASISEKAVEETYKPVISKSGDTFIVTVPGKVNTPVNITLYDENSGELYNQNLKDGKVAKKFNTSKIFSKEFTFVVSYNNKMFTETISK